MQIDVPSKYFAKFFDALPAVTGKVFVITGTTSGTGLVAARALLEKGGTVVMLNRESERSAKADASLRELVPDGAERLHTIACDLQSFASVRAAAEQVRERFPEVFCLCCNAGIMATPDKATGDGFDTQMQTNHLSHFLLTKELMPCLVAGAAKHGEDARVVTHSSIARTFPKSVDTKYYGRNGGKLGGDGHGSTLMMTTPAFRRYQQSKLANSVFIHAFNDRAKAAGVPVIALSAHPGGSATNLGDHLSFGGALVMCILKRLMQSAEDGSMGLLRCCADPAAEAGALYGPNGCMNQFSGPAVYIKPLRVEVDPKNKDALWTASEEAIGEPFALA